MPEEQLRGRPHDEVEYDERGRVYIPKHLRKHQGSDPDLVAVVEDDGSIRLVPSDD